MDIQGSLATRIDELEQERIKLQESLEIIRGKIEKADARYRSERDMGSYHKWSSILSGLEEELDRTRALLVSCEAELAERKRKLAGHEERTRSGADAAPSPEEEPGAATELKEQSSGKASAAGQPSQEDERPASLDEPAEKDAEPSEQPGAAAAQELHAETPEEDEAPSDTPQTEEQDAVADVVERIARGQLGEVTLGDFELMLDRYVEILHRLDPPPEEQEFEETLVQSLRKAEREMGRLRRKWLPYAPVDPD